MASERLFENPPAKGDYMPPMTEVIRYNEDIILTSDGSVDGDGPSDT